MNEFIGNDKLMLALYLQCSVSSFYQEVPFFFFEKFKQLKFQFARIFSHFLTHSFYKEAYPFSLHAMCYQIPLGKTVRKMGSYFLPQIVSVSSRACQSMCVP